MIDYKKELKNDIKIALEKIGESVDFDVEEPKNDKFGDLSSNVVLVLVKKLKSDPKEIAEKIIAKLPDSKYFNKPEFAAGFLNFKFNKSTVEKSVKEILDQSESYGKSEKGHSKKINIEFVSANPTGQLHIGNARGGPIGQTLANLYENFGYQVDREYYVNDFGVQVDKLARTLLYYYKKKTDPKLEMDEGHYPGKFIEEVFEKIFKKNQKILAEKTEDEQVSFFAKEGLLNLLQTIKEQLLYLGINFDRWTYESDILCSNKTDRAMQILKEKGFISNKEGALWLKMPEDPDLLDRETVLQKSDAEKSYTYFANDIAYHLDKFERGYVKAIDIWGANHFGHIPRLTAAVRALGMPENWLNIILYQNVRLKNGEEIIQMSKRKGNTITIDDLKEAGIEADVFKYMILSHDSNSLIDFDAKLAKDTSEKNPVYYIKYAHARICSILKKAHSASSGQVGDKDNVSRVADIKLIEDAEIQLAKELMKYPEILANTLEDYKLQRLPFFALSLATKFHTFYDKCRIIGEKKEVEQSRINLIKSTQIVLKNLLAIMGIEAPEKM